MSAPITHFRKEVQDYIVVCERLLSSTMLPHNEPLSDEERLTVEYYQDELRTRLCDLQAFEAKQHTASRTS